LGEESIVLHCYQEAIDTDRQVTLDVCFLISFGGGNSMGNKKPSNIIIARIQSFSACALRFALPISADGRSGVTSGHVSIPEYWARDMAPERNATPPRAPIIRCVV
jgi:hypothetical protein